MNNIYSVFLSNIFDIPQANNWEKELLSKISSKFEEYLIAPAIALIIYLGLLFFLLRLIYLVYGYITNNENIFKKLRKKVKGVSLTSFFVLVFDSIKKYIKNHNRLYLRINFGHKLSDEKDILRLIARTMETEYQRYHHKWTRKLPYRIMIFSILLLFTILIFKIDALANADDLNNQKLYLFWIVYFLIYLFSLFLFRRNWILNFFCTHQLIMRRLKSLNSDITYSTDREKSVNIRGNIEGRNGNIETKIKKSRNIADAREIEKELQEIINDMQRIPVIMCRPKIVIVFDELDKVESGDTDKEKENQQTKASLFSINAMRERQTEILRILSNMKYFLSTARAKFIFIAGREMYDIHLADVSERNNYIGSIFNTIVYVPSFLNDHYTSTKIILQESSIASLTEEFVCRKLIPQEYDTDTYNLKSYRKYLIDSKLCKGKEGIDNIIKSENGNMQKDEEVKIQKIIAVLQQFIIYLAHVSKGAPKKMIQLFEFFVEINIEKKENEKNTLFVQKYGSSKHFLSFNYYRQYTVGIVAYLITPIFFRLSESNIKEHSDKLLVSALRFVDFMFKFHKDSFSWRHLNMSPEMLEVNHAPELKSVAVDLVNYLTQIHINKSGFSLSDYKFDGLIANEIFSMAKTEEVFSALFSFSLDETLPLREYYQDLLKETKKDYQIEKKSVSYIDAISSLEVILGDLHYYADELEQAEAYYKSSVQAYRKLVIENDSSSGNKKEIMAAEKFYLYVRNMLRLGIIYEKRKQNDFAFQIYNELCKQIILVRRSNPIKNIKNYSRNIKSNDVLNNINYSDVTYEGLKILYLPFIAKFQILEKSHVGGILYSNLKLLDEEFYYLIKDHKNKYEKRILKAEYYSRLADIIYYKNSDLKGKFGLSRKDDLNDNDRNDDKFPRDCSCTACYYYHKALSILLNIDLRKRDENTVVELLFKSINMINDSYNMKDCTTLARILSDWGNVFYSCDEMNNNFEKCYIYDGKCCESNLYKNYKGYYSNIDVYNNHTGFILKNIFRKYNENIDISKMEIAFAMYVVSSDAYRKANIYKRSSYQLYKMICLIKDYNIFNYKLGREYAKLLSKKAIQYLWSAYEDINVNELNKRKKDFDRKKIEKRTSLRYLLADSEITRIKVLVSEINLKAFKNEKDLNKYYENSITSPYEINYSIIARICRLRLKTKINYEAYKLILKNGGIIIDKDREYVLIEDDFKKLIVNNKNNILNTIENIFDSLFKFKDDEDIILKVLESIIAESIYCLLDIAQLTETMDESYLFPHSFLGSVHEQLSFWIRQFEEYEKYKEDNSNIEKYLKQYLDEEWRNQLSGYRENKLAILHYRKCLEMHKSGRAYYNMIDTMCYVKDDFNDRIDHFNIAEERHLIVNGEIDKRIKELEKIYKDSSLYNVDNY
jgi:hypothetical protein